MRLIARASAAAIALLCASVAYAAYDAVPVTAVTLKRGSSNVTTTEAAAACARIAGCFMPLVEANCIQIMDLLVADEGATRETGSSVYQCLIAKKSVVTFKANPTPTCGARPGPDEQRQQTCPAGTVGTWLQDQTWTLQPYPTCWVLGEWTPAVPPEGMCAPADSDGDGVPDSTDECPTVYAATPNGCPATPPAQLAAPTNVRAQGISTSAIRVTWDAVVGAAAYSLERCIGSTCTGFTQLACVTGPVGTHSSLPANLTARYRVRASRDAACGTAAGNLGAYSAIASGTTLSATPQPEPTGTASLSWTPPTTNTDGSTLSNLAGYRVSYGSTPDALTQTIQISNAGASSYTVGNLAPGQHYFAVRAYTSGGTESANSNVVSKVVQ